MNATLKVLYVEDNPADVELCRHALRQAGYEPEIIHVDTEQAFVEGLADSFDVILADFSLPQFDAPSALRRVQERGVDLPFIVVSGTVGEETAVDLIKQGADDYLLKDRLGRLGAAIENARGQRRLKSERSAIEGALRTQDRLFRAVVEHATEGLALLSKDLRLTYLSPTAERMVGLEMKDFPGMDPVAVVHPGDQARARQILQASLETPRTPQYLDVRMRRQDGIWRWVECTIDNRLDQPEVQAVVVNIRDVDGRRRAEEALRQSEENYRLLFSSNPQPMWVYDRDSLAILQVNDAAVHAYGYAADEFRRMTILDLHPPEVHEKLRDVAAALPGRIWRPGIWPQVRKDGSGLEADITTHGLDFEGRPARLVMAIDVTEREHARRNLETSERRYRELTEEAPLGIYRTAPDGRILFVNPTLAHMLGYDDPNELLARSLESGAFEASYSRAEFKARLEAQGEIRGLEATWTRKDGSQLHIRENARLVRSPEGAYYEGTVEDITENKQAEQALRQLSEFNESLIRSMSEGIVLEERDGTFTFVNPAAASMLGYRTEELLGKPFSFVMPTDQLELVRAANQRRAYDESDRYELQLQRKDGTTFPVLVSGSPRFQDGEFAGTIAVFTDITELKAAQADLARRAQELEELYQTSLEINAQPSLETMLQAIVERATTLLGVQSGGLYLLQPDGETLEFAVVHGMLSKYKGTTLRRGEALSGKVLETGQTIVVEDYMHWPERSPQYTDTTFRRIVAVPLRVGTRIVGVLNAADMDKPGTFAPEEIRLAEMFADQAAIAVENARLLEETRRWAAHLEGVTSVSAALRVAADRNQMTDIIADQLVRLLDTPHVGIVLRSGEGEVVMAVGRGLAEAMVGIRGSAGQGIAGHVLERGHLFMSHQAGQDERIPHGEVFRDADHVMAVPLAGQDQSIGMIVAARNRPFDDEDIRLLSAVAEMAGNALNRAGVMETLEQRVSERTQDLEAANFRLQELDQLKSTFVSNVSHELRTPITNILLYLDLLEQPGREDRRPTYMGILRGESVRLHRLIEDLLTLSRLERGSMSLDLEPQVLDAIIAEVLASQEARAHVKQIELAHDPNPDMPPTPLAHSPMVQVLTNLIGNAVAYAPSGATVTVHAQLEKTRGGRYATVRVHNSAPAIPEEDLPHLFERFYRGRSAAESGEAGTGLGLSICKEIVERHHGWIEVESAPETGTAFTVWLPLDANE